ncbi:hypothetical protein STEG23_034575 [Scotinomys teguina]
MTHKLFERADDTVIGTVTKTQTKRSCTIGGKAETGLPCINALLRHLAGNKGRTQSGTTLELCYEDPGVRQNGQGRCLGLAPFIVLGFLSLPSKLALLQLSKPQVNGSQDCIQLDEEKVTPSVGKSTVPGSLPTLDSRMGTMVTFVPTGPIRKCFHVIAKIHCRPFDENEEWNLLKRS